MSSRVDSEIDDEKSDLLGRPSGSKDIVAVDLEWRDIKCTLRSKTSTKEILKGVSGNARSGEFLAIMGSSGAGKTTFLNIISGVTKTKGKVVVNGSVLANGQEISTINYLKYIGYVTQDDVLLDMLTVRESVMFAARLKTKGTESEKSKKVDLILEEIGLLKCQNTIIGNAAIKGVSGGEKKRTCIAIELITTPSILFLDEPTSGLDSFSALNVVELLNEQANKGRTVISTIHQPSSDIYIKFYKLLLLCDGRIMYHGAAKDAVQYFENLNYPCPPKSNPADFFIQLLYIENIDNKSPDEERTVHKINSSYLSQDRSSESELSTAPLEKGDQGFISGFIVQLYYCTQRGILILFRDLRSIVFRLLILMFVALMMDILFWDMGSSLDQSHCINRNGSFFFIISVLILANLQGTILTFPLMRQVFLKESRAKMYGTLAFFLSKNFSELLLEVLFSTIFGVSVIWSLGYNTSSAEKPVYFLIAFILSYMSGTSLGLVAGAWFTRVEVASSLGALMTVPFYYYSGFLRPINDIPVWVRWVSYFSPFRYAFDTIMITQYEDADFGNNTNQLTYYDISGSVGESIAYLILVMIGFRILAFIGLKYNSNLQ
jgi:ABC-type multidrug transport system ATPase subunit/ABC-type multidrug transport system permease subunit